MVRAGQPDPDDRARASSRRSIRARRSAWSFRATRASRAACRRRGSATSRRALGVAYSPNEKTSLRASYGLFYTAFQGLSAGIMYGVPPYGYNYLSPAPPLFETPFITAADGTNNGQRFPQQFPPLDASPSNPVTNIDWSQFLPVNADPFFGSTTRRRTPRTSCSRCSASWRRTWWRPPATSARAGTTCWCCSRPTRAIPALCLSVSQPSQVAPGSATCGPFGENGVFTTRGRHGDQQHAHRAGARTTARSRSRRRSAIRATTRSRLNLRYTQGAGHASWPATRTASRWTCRRISASR